MKLIKDFLKYQAKTTPHPLSIEIKNAFGSHIVDSDNKKSKDTKVMLPNILRLKFLLILL